jgi:hypothetical protein
VGNSVGVRRGGGLGGMFCWFVLVRLVVALLLFAVYAVPCSYCGVLTSTRCWSRKLSSIELGTLLPVAVCVFGSCSFWMFGFVNCWRHAIMPMTHFLIRDLRLCESCFCDRAWPWRESCFICDRFPSG